ncbi:MAG TPA: nicotianamine synthase family protein [Hyphomicrobiaceae bacterium]|jgi:hypothetical protein|nr:nicotianamine synthase family protein [Hyphomicrobiaceae bacterium]
MRLTMCAVVLLGLAAGGSMQAHAVKELRVDARDGARSAILVPAQRARAPTVIVLHGALISAEYTAHWYGFIEAAADHGFAAVFPRGINLLWNDGREAWTPDRTLVDEGDLSPRNPRVNNALSALVHGIMQGCVPADAEEVLADPAVCAVRGQLLEKLAIAEGELEKHWAKMLCARASLTVCDFREFIYWGCYCHLVTGEFHNLPPGLNIRKRQSIAFVGAGPLPLSAIILHVRTGMRGTCIDLDPHACTLARDLCRKASLAAIDVTCADGARYGYRHHPVVFVASLVREKSNVVERIREECPHAVVALRSAEGLCTLLYDPVDEKALEAMGCGILGRTAYDPQAINTTLFCRAASALRGTGAGPACRPAAAPSEGFPVAVSGG